MKRYVLYIFAALAVAVAGASGGWGYDGQGGSGGPGNGPFTRPEEVACGCEILYRTLLRLDRINRLA